LLSLVASDCTEHRVLVTGSLVGDTFDVTLRLGSLVLCLAFCVLLATGLLPRLGASRVANLS
jgi:hypothetical protein